MLLIFGMWGAKGGRHLQYKNDFNSKREHAWSYVCLKIALSVKYSWCGAPAFLAA